MQVSISFQAFSVGSIRGCREETGRAEEVVCRLLLLVWMGGESHVELLLRRRLVVCHRVVTVFFLLTFWRC